MLSFGHCALGSGGQRKSRSTALAECNPARRKFCHCKLIFASSGKINTVHETAQITASSTAAMLNSRVLAKRRRYESSARIATHVRNASILLWVVITAAPRVSCLVFDFWCWLSLLGEFYDRLPQPKIRCPDGASITPLCCRFMPGCTALSVASTRCGKYSRKIT